jgi:7,8-dihydropterin-6-yl-methyl-4-(beta-D-ribofuranosyl)aminobenzene 5'-phosphate synthase
MKIVFDNYTVCKECHSLWGFSSYLPEYKLLFDTGSNGRVLLQNMQKMGVDVQEIEYLFLSHSHWDHIGGVDSIIELNPNITLFAPASLSKHLLGDLKSMVKKVVICGKKPMQLFDNLYTTGLLGSEMPEQSLIIDGEKPEVITGCGHYGVDKIVVVAKEFLGKDIEKVSGGFHLLRSEKEKILQVIEDLKAMGVSETAPTHCSGDTAIALFGEAFKK